METANCEPRRKRRWIACCICAAVPAPVFAHHSAAIYDLTKEVLLEGTLANVAWTNPHIYLTVETVGTDGRPLLQEIEVAPIAAARASGLEKERLVVGSHVIVRANPSRRGPGGIVKGLDIATNDGAIYPLAASGRNSTAPSVTAKAVGLAGNWAPAPTVILGLRQAVLTHWPLTEAGRTALADLQGQLAASAGCDPFPPPMLTALNMLRTIELRDEFLMLRFDTDWGNVERSVRLNQRTHANNVTPTLLGDSIGWWEGDTLVIDTVGFAPHRQGVGFGVPSSSRKHMVERFSLTDDRLNLRYEFTLEDPDYLSAPVSHTALWQHRPDLEASGVACDPEVALRFLERNLP